MTRWFATTAGFAVSARLLHGAFLALALVAMLIRMDNIQRGFVFTFLSLGALYAVGELAIPTIVVRWLAFHRQGEDLGLAKALEARAWNLSAMATCLSFVLVTTVGALVIYEGHANKDIALSAWLGPWISFAIASAVQQFLYLRLAIMEGGVSPKRAWRLNRDLELASGTAFVAAIFFGWGLWSPTLYVVTRLFFGVFMIGYNPSRRRTFEPMPWSEWIRDIWPFQWRVALNAVSYFVMFRAFNSIVFVKLGAEAAGTLGIGFAAMSMVVAISAVWPASQAAVYSEMWATGDLAALRRHFANVVIGSTVFSAVLSTCALGTVYLLKTSAITQASSLPTAQVFAVLLSAAVCHHFIAAFVPLLRADGKERLLSLSIAGSLLTFGACWIAASVRSEIVLVTAYAASLLIGIPYCLCQYRLAFTAWMQPSAVYGGI